THAFFLGGGTADWRRKKDRALERWDGRPNDSNALFVSARDELTIAGYQALGAHTFGEGYERARKEDVIDAKSEDDVPDACLSQHVTFEACQPTCTKGW